MIRNYNKEDLTIDDVLKLALLNNFFEATLAAKKSNEQPYNLLLQARIEMYYQIKKLMQ
jgi:hypothetical protein